MSRYLVFDLETENNKTYRRFANPFDPINYVVARGWKFQGDTRCSWEYFDGPGGINRLHIPDDVTMLIGQNIKFDLLYEWENPELKAFFKRGGRIWDTQYVEYLLNGMRKEFHMVSMDAIAEKYGGRVKIDAVKALWEAGYLTSQIDKDMLIDYLVGTEEEGRDSGDIGNTEKIFLGQLTKVIELGMLTMVMARMDGLCATTEMEFNGLKIDVKEAGRRTKEINQELKEVIDELNQYIPELPEELEFNWNSDVHVSVLLFGGHLKYKKKSRYIDEETGELARKIDTVKWPLFDGTAIDPALCGEDDGVYWYDGVRQDVSKSGKTKGEPKFKNVKVAGEFKEKFVWFTFEFEGYTEPKPSWAGSKVDGAGNPTYSVAEDIIEELGYRNVPFLKLLARRQSLAKDLGTYYVKWDEKKKEWKGMLACVMKESHIIHHNLNHTSTVTGRLSSDNPNMQNIPKADTSEVKKMFVSRFGDDGQVVEADYSQLEVVVQGLLTGDVQLILDLNNKVDFHCKRVSAWKGCTYEEAVYRCKNENYEEYKLWKSYRTDAKVFSFQRAYGAGAAKIALTTGMKLEDVEALIEAENTLYPGIIVFNDNVERAVKASAIPFRDPTRGYKTYRRGTWQAPTGTLYCWRSHDALAYQRRRGIEDSFKPTELKNYPVQGTGGEIVQIICGKLWRHFVSNDNYGGKALLTNTVHDSVWIDSHKDVLNEMGKAVKEIMESVPETLNELYGMEVPVPFPVELEAGDNMYTKHLLHL